LARKKKKKPPRAKARKNESQVEEKTHPQIETQAQKDAHEI
jgi:hypothetical protein